MADESIGQVVVEIRARIDSLDRDFASARQMFEKFFQQQQTQATTTSKLLGAAFSGINSQLVAMSAGLGPIGVGLAALGPAGLLAGAAIETIAKSFEDMKASGAFLGDYSKAIERVATTTGAGIANVIGLTEVASKLGIESQRTEHWLTRMGFAFESARENTGPLATSLRELGGNFLEDFQKAKTFTDQLNVFTQAVNASSDKQHLLRPTLGRDSAEAVRLFEKLGTLGGVGSPDFTKIVGENPISPEMVDRLAAVKKQTDDLASSADKAWAAIGGEKGAARTLALTQVRKDIGEVTAELEKNMSVADAWVDRQSKLLLLQMPLEVQQYALENFRKQAAELNKARDDQAKKNADYSAGVVQGTGAFGGGMLVKAPEPTFPTRTPLGSKSSDMWYKDYQESLKNLKPPLDEAKKSQDSLNATVLAALTPVQQATADVNAWTETMKALGPAATLTEKLKDEQLKANQAILQSGLADKSDTGLSKENVQARRDKVNAINDEISALSTLMGILGASATIEQKISAANKAAELKNIQLGERGLNQAQMADVMALNKLREQGVLAIQKTIATQAIEANAYDMGVGAATRYKLIQEALTDDAINHRKRSDEDTAALYKWADAAGKAADNAARLKLSKDLAFESKTMFLSTEDEAVATRLRDIYGNDIPAALASSEAAQIKFNARLKEAQTNTSDFLNTFVQGMAKGQTATAALASALQSLGSSLIKKGIEDGTRQLFSGMQGPLASLFGVKSGSTANLNPIAGIGALGSTPTNAMWVQMAPGAGTITGAAGNIPATAGVPGMPTLTGTSSSSSAFQWPSVPAPGGGTASSLQAPGSASNFNTGPVDVNVAQVAGTGNLPPILAQTGNFPTFNAAPGLSDNLVNSVKKFEGFTPTAQWDYKQLSNGFGTKAAFPGETIDLQTANARLTSELTKAQTQVQNFAPGLPQGTNDALTSLTYNSGTKWMGQGLGKAVQSGDMDKAAQIFPQYNQAGGAFNQGLANRRTTEMGWWGQGGQTQQASSGASDFTSPGGGAFSQGGITGAGSQIPGFEDFNKGMSEATKGLTGLGDKVPDLTNSLSTGLTSASTGLTNFTGQGITPAIQGLTTYSNTALTNAATSTTATTGSVTTLGATSELASTEISAMGGAAAGRGAGGLGSLFGGAAGGAPAADAAAIPLAFADGGWIPNTGPVIAHENEFIMNPASARRFGPILEAMNKGNIRIPKMLEGGIAGVAMGRISSTSQPSTSQNQSHPGAQGGQPGGVKIVNAFDASDMLEHALNSRQGERVMLNFVRSNQGSFRGAINK